MTRQLVMVHGRTDAQKDSIALKAEWLEALEVGLAKSNLTLPVPETDVRLPFYGDTLYERMGGGSDDAAHIVVRGRIGDDNEARFTLAVMEDIRQKTGITDAQLSELTGRNVVERGPLWEWSQGYLKAVDRFVPYASGASIALITHDLYRYLTSPEIRDAIDTSVSAAMTPGVETVVVAHSLGTVVAYNLLRQQGHLRGWRVPLYVTLGSPLAVTEIRKMLRGFAPTRCPESVSQWFNAMDERDVVALYPLDAAHFPLNPATPAIENKKDVRNRTRNRHEITGYLDDAEVAKRVYDALMG